MRNNGHDGLGGILILEFICIKVMTMVFIFKEDQTLIQITFNIPSSFPCTKKENCYFSLDSWHHQIVFQHDVVRLEICQKFYMARF